MRSTGIALQWIQSHNRDDLISLSLIFLYMAPSMLSQAGAYIALHPLHSLHQKLFQLLYLQQGEYSLGSSFCYLIIDETLKLLPSKSTLLFHKGFSKETLVWGNTSSEGKGLTPSYAKAFCQHIVILGQSLPSVFIGV